ncbi:hypothetical protein Nepgr_000465 [Nepenthes gracilis]|uniref:Uncharacterized protein n=1 Tax=Nepenthes gracilis TaxID=150966 RepID=A0AAD3RWH5_NEPGR|nr:hypothetical protein Nepgr_000465 [Nepenthes gracilis]
MQMRFMVERFLKVILEIVMHKSFQLSYLLPAYGLNYRIQLDYSGVTTSLDPEVALLQSLTIEKAEELTEVGGPENKYTQIKKSALRKDNARPSPLSQGHATLSQTPPQWASADHYKMQNLPPLFSAHARKACPLEAVNHSPPDPLSILYFLQEIAVLRNTRSVEGTRSSSHGIDLVAFGFSDLNHHVLILDNVEDRLHNALCLHGPAGNARRQRSEGKVVARGYEVNNIRRVSLEAEGEEGVRERPEPDGSNKQQLGECVHLHRTMNSNTTGNLAKPAPPSLMAFFDLLKLTDIPLKFFMANSLKGDIFICLEDQRLPMTFNFVLGLTLCSLAQADMGQRHPPFHAFLLRLVVKVGKEICKRVGIS